MVGARLVEELEHAVGPEEDDVVARAAGGVAELVRHPSNALPGLEGEGRPRVADRVELEGAHAFDLRAAAEPISALLDVVLVPGRRRLGAEDPLGDLAPAAREGVPTTGRQQIAELRGGRVGEADSAAAPTLRRRHLALPDRAADRDPPPLEVHVRPLHAQGLATPAARREEEDDHRRKPRLVLAGARGSAGSAARRAYPRGWINLKGHVSPADRREVPFMVPWRKW